MSRFVGPAAMLAVSSGVQVTPVQKVTELLTKLQTQVTEEGKAEAASYDKYSEFCRTQANEKVYVIGRSDEKIAGLDAFIAKNAADIVQLDEEVVETKGKVETEEAEAKEKHEIRAEEHKTYVVDRADLKGAVDACTAAIDALKASRDKAVTNAEAGAVLLSMRKALALLGFEKRLAAPGDAPTYDYQSGDIIATIEKLFVTFRAELTEKDEEESTRAHDHNMVEGARANKVSSMKAAIAEKEAISAHKGQEKSKAEKVLAEETTDRDADQSFLDDLTSRCEAKATAWDARSEARANEITAINEAIAALKSMGDAYSSNKKLATGLVGVAKHNVAAKHVPSFLQIEQSGPAKMVAKLRRHVGEAAKRLHSSSLASLASKISSKSGEDHFVKVRGIIKDLVAKLEADAEEEATAKSLCDEQIGEAVSQRDEEAHNMEKISTDISSTETSITSLNAEIKQLGVEIADLHKALDELTKLRDAERTVNEKTVNDAMGGADAVASAITSLKAFYGDAFLQYVPPNSGRDGKTVGDMAPETFDTDEEYVGKVDASKGIFGLLEVIQSDFERTVETTKAAEEAAQTEFEKVRDEMDASIAEKGELKSTKESEVEAKEADLTGFKDDLGDATTLHGESLDQLAKLKKSCIDSDETYEERVAARKKEIEALKEALNMLENWKN